MGTDERDEVVDIASHVVDGVPVDWPSARERVVEDSRDVVEQLRVIAEIARVHHALPAVASSAFSQPPPAPGGVPWGPLLVFEKLGSGAFGDVFRAWDTSLQREVALKRLRSAADAAVEEGQRLARVSHPNVMAVYGAQRVGTEVGIWGELLRGRTLAALIAGEGPLSADETLIAGESICRALGAVHRGGLLHRDVKAQNVFREKGGRLVLMDFGLGRDLDASALQATVSDMSGTPPYLAPELFEGGRASVQSDIYSLGVLLFFLATGAYPVTGASLDDIARAHHEGRRARLQDLRPELPRQFVQIVERALDPDPAKRYQSAGAMQTALARAVHGDDARIETDGGGRVAPLTVVAACAAVALIVAAGVWAVLRPAPAAAPRLARFAIVPSSAQSLDIQDNDRNLAISPDGRHLVYRSVGTSSGGPLMLRPLDQLGAQPLHGIANGRDAFFSADSRSVGFFDGNDLKRILLTGEPAVRICGFNGFPRGASWGDDNTIVFATNDKTTGLLRVPAGGGTPVSITTLDPSQHEDHLFPSVLPRGRGVLFTIQRDPEPATQVAILDSRTGRFHPLIPNASQAEYVPPPPGSSGPGYLLYAAGGRLLVVRFNVDDLGLVGPSVPIVEHLQTAANGAASYAVAGTGTLAYIAGELEPPRSLVWVDRQGREEPIGAPEHTYGVPRLSPDGRKLVVEVRAQDHDLWTWDFSRPRLVKLTFGAARDVSPVWSADSRRVLFASDRADDPYTVYAHNSDGTGAAEQIATAENAHPTSIDRDGAIVSTQFVESRARIIRLSPGKPPEPLVNDPVDQRNGQVSPNGRFIAYESRESHRPEVYVRTYPDPRGGHWQVSTEGGSTPMWAHSGTEMFFLDASYHMAAVPVVTNRGEFSSGVPQRLFDASSYMSGGGRGYDVSPDGSRFLLVKDIRPAESGVAIPSILLVLNWLEDVRPKIDQGRR